MQAASGAKANTAELLVEHLLTRFEKEYRDDVIKAMSVFDRMSWTDSKNFGVDEIKLIGEHFRTPLEFSGYSESKVAVFFDFLNK